MKLTGALFLLAYLVTLVICAPASLLDALAHRTSGGVLALANAEGTVWHGHAIPALQRREGGYITLQPLHWDIALLPLFSGKISALLHWDEADQTEATEAVLSLRQLELRHLLLPLPAEVLGNLTPLLYPIQLSGLIQIRSDHLLLSRLGIDGNAIADWAQAGSALSAVNPLGTYRIALSGAGNHLDAQLSTSSGALQLEGTGSWTRERGMEFHGHAQAAPENREQLAELLQHLGPEYTPGVRTINLTPAR